MKLEDERKCILKSVYIELTREEAEELRDSLEAILVCNEAGRHEHINNKDYSQEITISVTENL